MWKITKEAFTGNEPLNTYSLTKVRDISFGIITNIATHETGSGENVPMGNHFSLASHKAMVNGAREIDVTYTARDPASTQ
jgi:hypothetical protein